MTLFTPHSADIVLIDGRSGAGKTSLAATLAARIERNSAIRPQIVAMDELYPGWRGLHAGSASLPGVLRSATYARYDWLRAEFTTEVALARSTPLIVEGCGSITRDSLVAAQEWGRVYSIWIEAPAPVRKHRALTRDGDMFAPHWDEWAAQEAEHYARHQPIRLAREIRHID